QKRRIAETLKVNRSTEDDEADSQAEITWSAVAGKYLKKLDFDEPNNSVLPAAID
ncbi:hypothetical protein HHI36_001754, partial [Cryptolaemus montrouzieri]